MRDDYENMIDQYFRNGLDNLNVIPPVEVWNNIAEQLPVKKRSRKLFVWISVAASVSLFAAVTGWYYINRGNTTSKMQAVEQIASNPRVTPGIEKGNAAEKTSKYNTSADEMAISPAKRQKDNTADVLDNTQLTVVASIEGKNKNSGVSNEKPEVIASVANNGNNSLNTGLTALAPSNESMAPIAALTVKDLNPEASYGKIETGSIVLKIDSNPAYDDYLAYTEVSGEKEKLNRWALGGQVAPLYSYRNVAEVNVPGITKSSMNKMEDAVMTFASGVKVDYEATSRLTFQTGIFYMKMGQEMENVSSLTHPKVATSARNSGAFAEYSTTPPPAINSTGTIITASPELYALNNQTFDKSEYMVGNMVAQPASLSRKDIEQSFEFIEIPFLAKYKIIDRKVNVHLLGGVSTNVLVNNTAKLTSTDNVTEYGKTADVQTFNYSSSVGFGMVYNLGKNLMFSVEPTFKYYLNSFNTNSEIKLHPYAFGVYSGVSFKF